MAGSVSEEAVRFNEVNREVEQYASAVFVNHLVERSVKYRTKQRRLLTATVNCLEFYQECYNKNRGRGNETNQRKETLDDLWNKLNAARESFERANEQKNAMSINSDALRFYRESSIASVNVLTGFAIGAPARIPRNVIIPSICGVKAAKFTEMHSKTRGIWVKGNAIRTIPENQKFEQLVGMLGLDIEGLNMGANAAVNDADPQPLAIMP